MEGETTPKAAPGPILGSSEGDLALQALGVKRLAIPIPFRAAGGPVNVYLIDNADGSLTLFDSGLGTDEARADLVRGFAEAGRRLEEVTRILVSHGHIDHYGAAKFVVGRSGAKVFVHPLDASKVTASGRWVEQLEVYRAYFLKLGVPEDFITSMAKMAGDTERYAERVDAVEPLADGQRFTFARFEAEVLHLPGHTPGLVCLHLAKEKILFADDHALARVSPNPLIELDARGEAHKFQSLVSYIASAKKVRELELEWILPGHGAPFRDHRAVLDGLFGFYAKRQEKIVAALTLRPMTACELLAEVFPRGRISETYLMLSEIVGNLEVLEAAARVRKLADAVPWLYAPASQTGAAR